MTTPIPQTTTVANLTGKYSMNKTLSDASEETLKLQNVGWLVRKVAANSAVSIHLKDYVDPQGVRRMDLDQISTGGMRNAEERWIDWEWREKDDKIWGKVKGRAKSCKLSEVPGGDAFLTEGFEEEDTIFQEITSASGGWTTVQVWGFGVVEGQRRHVRKVVTTKGKDVARIRLVYDWEGPN